MRKVSSIVKRVLIILGLLTLGFKAVFGQPIRILILKDKEKVEISSPTSLEITEVEGDVPILITGESMARCEIRVSGEGLMIADIKVSHTPILIRSNPGLPLLVNGRRYRGELEVKRGIKGIDVINIIDLEEYLYGVIKREICPNWPMEAVKAQAVAARTFAYSNLGRHMSNGYDLCSNYHCQVYGGFESETQRSIEAVDATRGEVLTYGGKLINSIYHATCGGQTANSSMVYGSRNNLEYLKGVVCFFCKESPHYSWSYRIGLDKIRAKLNERGYSIGKILRISPSKKDEFGRIGELIIVHSQGRTRINANTFRLILGPEKVRSTAFELIKMKDGVEFRGLGWGHGVGMCQWGAKGMAESGFDYKAILGYYYPETQILKILETPNTYETY